MPMYRIKIKEDGKEKVVFIRAANAQIARRNAVKSALRRGKSVEL